MNTWGLFSCAIFSPPPAQRWRIRVPKCVVHPGRTRMQERWICEFWDYFLGLLSYFWWPYTLRVLHIFIDSWYFVACLLCLGWRLCFFCIHGYCYCHILGCTNEHHGPCVFFFRSFLNFKKILDQCWVVFTHILWEILCQGKCAPFLGWKWFFLACGVVFFRAMCYFSLLLLFGVVLECEWSNFEDKIEFG